MLQVNGMVKNLKNNFPKRMPNTSSKIFLKLHPYTLLKIIPGTEASNKYLKWVVKFYKPSVSKYHKYIA